MTGATRWAPVLVALTGLSTCLSGAEFSKSGRSDDSVTRFVVRPARVRISAGQLLLLHAIENATDRAGRPISASWTSASPAIAAVSRDGLVIGMSPGVTEITASIDGQSATARVEVAAPAEGPSAAILLGAGDIADCDSGEPEATARILDTIPGTVFTAGDNVYPRGSRTDFAECYDLTWGRHKYRTRPSPGNHDYRSKRAAPYYAYFGANAGDPAKGYYSYDLGEWHIVALNSEVDMKRGSPQERWLRADLAASRARCTLAYMHRPRFSSGDSHGSQRQAAALFQALYDNGAEVVIGGHDHVYERFAPQTPDGQLDRARGVRQFVVGTGGRDRDGFRKALPNSETRYNDSKGIIRLALSPGRYTWEFVPVSGAFRDRGSDSCH